MWYGEGMAKGRKKKHLTRKQRRNQKLIRTTQDFWTPFEESELSPEAKAGGYTRLLWNSRYHLFIREMEHEIWGGKLVHLSIKRNDKECVHDWRDLQRIKNEVVGEEREAVELYPAESRLVDQANQYHLWVLPEGQCLPLGWFEGRVVGTPAEASEIGAKQRSFED